MYIGLHCTLILFRMLSLVNSYPPTSYRPGVSVVQPVSPPPAPDRTSSRTDNVTPEEDLLYLVGRKPYVSNAAADASQDSSSPDFMGVKDFMGKIMDTSTSDDATSVFSMASKTSSVGRPGSGSLHRGLAKTASDALSRMSAESDGGTSRQFVRTRSPGLAVAQSAISSESPDLPTTSVKEPDLEVRKHISLRSTKSLPLRPEEDGETEPGLTEIKEGEELASPRASQERELPHLDLPTSPTRKVASSSSRKIRLASKSGPGRPSARKGGSRKFVLYRLLGIT